MAGHPLQDKAHDQREKYVLHQGILIYEGEKFLGLRRFLDADNKLRRRDFPEQMSGLLTDAPEKGTNFFKKCLH